MKGERRKYIESFTKHFRDSTQEQFRDSLIKGAVTDGLRQSHNATKNTDGEYLAALFFSDSEHDFHWYRQDDSGYWSHKDRYFPAANTDDQGCLITDVRSLKNGQYPVFGGYFYVPREGVQLKPMSI